MCAIGRSLLRQQVASVPQTAVLFTGTIRENLQWGKPNATDEDCWEALAIAQCKEFVEQLDQGLDTPVNEGGKTFWWTKTTVDHCPCLD